MPFNVFNKLAIDSISQYQSLRNNYKHCISICNSLQIYFNTLTKLAHLGDNGEFADCTDVVRDGEDWDRPESLHRVRDTLSAHRSSTTPAQTLQVQVIFAMPQMYRKSVNMCLLCVYLFALMKKINRNIS